MVFLSQGTNYDARYPYVILLVLFILSTVITMFLPETLHQKLPETIRDAKKFGKTQPFWFIPKANPKTSVEEREQMEMLNGSA